MRRRISALTLIFVCIVLGTLFLSQAADPSNNASAQVTSAAVMETKAFLPLALRQAVLSDAVPTPPIPPGNATPTPTVPLATPTPIPTVSPEPTASPTPIPSWTTEIIDSEGVVGMWTSIAIDSNDRLHISYVGCNGGDCFLKYATNANGSWTTAIIRGPGSGITSTVSPASTSIVVDSRGKVYIGYIDRWTNRARVMVRDTSGTWLEQKPLSEYAWGSYEINGLSLAVDKNDVVHLFATRWFGSDGTGYYNYAATLYTNNSNGTFDISSPVQSLSACSGGFFTLWAPSIYIDSNGRVHISYVILTSYGDVWGHGYKTNKSGTWAGCWATAAPGIPREVLHSNRYFAVDSQGNVRWPKADPPWPSAYRDLSLALDSKDTAHVLGFSDGRLWHYELASSGTSPYALEIVDSSSTAVGASNSTAVDSHGRVHVSYFDGANGDLKHAVR